jgi:hypothetical protein
MLPGAIPPHPVYAAIQDNLHAGRGRTIHFHWLQNGSVFPLPGQPLPPLHVIEATYQRALLDADYDALAAHQRRFERAMRTGEVRVTSPAGTDIRFRIGDRPVNFQDGDASAVRGERGVILIDREIELPAGALRVAPLEESVNGTIAFPPSPQNRGRSSWKQRWPVPALLAAPSGNLRSGSIRCSQCRMTSHGSPTTDMVPAQCDCLSVTTRNSAETSVADM